MKIRESISIIEANIEAPSLASIQSQIIKLQEHGAEIAAAQIKELVQALDRLVPGHKFSMDQGMGSTTIDIRPPIVEESEDGEQYHKYDMVSPSDMGFMEHDYVGDFVPQMVAIMKQIFEIAEYVDEHFNCALGTIK